MAIGEDGNTSILWKRNEKIARSSYLQELHKLEGEGLVKIWKLMEVSVYLKSIESQSVATCLRVFCEEMYTSIINNPGVRENDECEHTATFIKTVANWWKILIVKRIGVDV